MILFSMTKVWGADITIDGATYTVTNPYIVNASSSDNYIFTNGGYMKITTDKVTLNGDFSGSGNLIVSHDTSRIQVHMQGSMSDFSGTVLAEGAAWFGFNGNNFGSENVVWTANSTETDATGLLPHNITTTTFENPIQLGRLEGDGALRPMGGTLSGGTYYVQVGHLLTNATDTSTFAGNLKSGGTDAMSIEKVGAGTWILTGTNSYHGAMVISEGTLQLGNGGTTGSLSSGCAVTVNSGTVFAYNRSDTETIYPQSSVTVKGGTIRNMGSSSLNFRNATFDGGGTIDFAGTAPGAMTFTNLTLNGEGRLTIDTTSAKDGNSVNLAGTLQTDGSANQEIYLTGNRAKQLHISCDLSEFTGTLTAGSAKDSSAGTWIVMNAARDASQTTFNLIPGQNIDAGLLLNYTPAADGSSVLQLGALSGNGIIRLNNYDATAYVYKIQIGGNNQDAVFSGGIQRYQNDDYAIEKVGTGTWTITSDGYYYNANAQGYKNNYTGDTTITAGTLRLGDYNPATGEGGLTGQLGPNTANTTQTKIVIGSAGTLSVARNTDGGGEITIRNDVESNGGIIEVISPTSVCVALRGSVTGSFTKTGTGVLAIGTDNGDALTKITIQEGTLRNWGASRLGNGATAIDLAGGTFNAVSTDQTYANKFTLIDGTSSTISNDAGINITISSAISGTGNLTKAGAGTLYLTGGNNFSGRLTVAAGTVQVGNNTNSYIDNNAPVTVQSGAAFGYNQLYDAAAVEPTNVFTVNNGTLFNAGDRAIHFRNVAFTGGTLRNTGTGLLTASSTSLSGTINFEGTVDNDIVLNIDTSTAAQSVTGLVSVNDVDSIINFTSSTRSNFLKINGPTDTFRGTINVSGDCWIAFNSGTALGSEYAVWNTAMTLNSGLLLENNGLVGKTVKLGDLTGNGWVRPGNTDDNSTVTLEVGHLGNDSIFSGCLRYGSDPNTQRLMDVVKVGTGTWTLASEGQVTGVTYGNTSNMTVREGTLILNRTSGQASAANMTIEPDGTLRVASNGQTISGALKMTGGNLEMTQNVSLNKDVTIAGATGVLSQMDGNLVGNINVQSGGLSPGSSQNPIGTLTVVGNLTLQDTDMLKFDIASASLYDRLVVDGALILEEGQKITLDVAPDLNDSIFSMEILVAEEVQIGDLTFDVSEVDWNQILDAIPSYMFVTTNALGGVVLTNQVPEPHTLALMLLGLLFLVKVRRRKA